MIFNLLTGVNSAGSGIKTNSLFKYIFIVLSPDILFFILYGFARDSKYIYLVCKGVGWEDSFSLL